MAEPWLSIIGLGEDGLAGLTSASRAALAAAEFIFGGARHLERAGVQGRVWAVPFDLAPVLALRGRNVAVLASGDPFWHGVGGTLSAHLAPAEWRAFPAPSTFSLVAARLGWRLEEVICLGLHAAPLARLRPVLARGQRLICLVRDGAAVAELAFYLAAQGFGASTLWGMEALGGPREKVWKVRADRFAAGTIAAPVAVAIEAVGVGMARASGLPDEMFEHDGQITKRAVRAMTLSALAPRPGEVLWDIGSGSGSVAIEFLLAATGSVAHALEADPVRAARARGNAENFGLGHRYLVTEARVPEGLADLPPPDVVFIGGGASEAVLAAVWPVLPQGGRLVVNGVTLETEALLIRWQGDKGGALLRIELAEAGPLGSRRGWQPLRPVVQWSAVR